MTTGLKKTTLVLCFLLLPVLWQAAHKTPVFACAPIDRGFYGYSFLNLFILPENSRQALAPLFMRFDKLYGEYFQAVSKGNQDDNLKEWHQRFCGQVTPEDLEYIIYKADEQELTLLLTASRSKSLPIPSSLRDNTFAEFVFDNKCPETVEYLIFAKKCEPHVTTGDQWEVLSKDKDAMTALIAEGKKAFKRTQSQYIRLRYAYQIIRLAHYMQDYEGTLDLYDELMPQVDKTKSKWSESIIPWWIEGHRAGALRKLGNHVEASYLFAKVYEKCPGRRATAYQSFYLKSDAEWEECLRMCATDQERATLFALRAAGAETKAVEDMEQVYALDPRNENLETLLVQEIRKMERNLLGNEFNPKKENNKRHHKIPRPYAGNYVISLQKFVRQVAMENKVARPALWHIAQGYLEFLAGDYYAAEKTLREAARRPDLPADNDDPLREQIGVFQLALQIAAFDKPTREVEETAYNILKDNQLYKKYRSFPDFLQDKMAYLFRQYQQGGKAFLSQHPLSDLKPNPSLEMLDDLIAAALKADQTSFERLLMDKNPVNDILDMKAVLLMSTGQMEAAFETFKRIPATNWDEYGNFSPFRETTKDCVHCFQRADTGLVVSGLNRGELLESLLDLEYKAKADLEKAASHYYRLGVAHYNISFFGYEWRAMDYFRSGSTWASINKGKNGVYPYWQYPVGNRENTDLSRALYFFEKARLLATDPELGAKAAFYAARCEQKMFFQSPGYRPPPCRNCIPAIPAEFLSNFNRLKTLYAGTDFYQLIIKECKYFELYAQKN
jgi:hypothetical protein